MKGNTALRTVGLNLNKLLTTELRDQGHYLTGSLENSINNSFNVVQEGRRVVLYGFALDYSIGLNDGVNSGRKLPTVDELTKYFLLRKLPLIQAKQAAILTAKRHKKEGMPTKASARFSKTGVRTNFINRVWTSNEQKIDSAMNVNMDAIFEEETKKQRSETI